ncbi:SUMF1/EgtB/PvdO family nonheme iron enzyme [Streptomyces sp. NBC_00102]|uniref:SUMF1/EgtB/PvdO family nonheme iron enzyme n=1 Tax=Streptomyces sp. NBC_00102 TaxID=2975652 RepID=UPI00225AE5E7|nr:SUMF1/EgtB/PvdO family nonheme iron enzyme [Streptomyces sp. NBC_00102]MCX5395583.1 hypothetical protein [Streptomyces sp. NBC_00102]
MHGRTVGSGPTPTAPVLVLGTFERVGSNWLSDTFRNVMPQHNEPFRQQLGRSHPLSPRARTAADLRGVSLGRLGWHHLTCALDDLYGVPRHMVKETNLFFATDTILALLPASPVVLLTRAPVGIASSFARGGLWQRWGYDDRYAQLAATARSPRWRSFASLLPQDDPAEPLALGRLVAVNALLLARALMSDPSRSYRRLSYEAHVRERDRTVDGVATFVGVPVPAASVGTVGELPPRADTTFATTQSKTGLVAELDSASAELVQEGVREVLTGARVFFNDTWTDAAESWLSGDDEYELRIPARGVRGRSVRAVTQASAPGKPLYVRKGDGPAWRNYLISNNEMAEMLTLLHAAGTPNAHFGAHLLVCPMPHERGGRLHFDPARRQWTPSPGFEHHPAYWVTWIGAAAFAAWEGSRLPTRAEMVQWTAGVRPQNTDYSLGDTTGVVQAERSPAEVHHLVGNLQVWCGDGPNRGNGPLQRYLHGAAWNTPSSDESVHAVRHRYLLGASRGVGVRLVQDQYPSRVTALGAWEIAQVLRSWIDGLGGPEQHAGAPDHRLVSALTGKSETDG